ncbi:dTDP-4-dehydrorhamnose 3,5-epimerase [Agriterribacter sp.]|uniref:dTDP-4-dehydrorhamnose 3,5-epimerase n=1 Tax=Agriterribacter sp. TaxID=2821509 RepID=UPI002C346617|nr:dTDP-4-dehydrorhamnose 3,5-epimerase [Agriterribacter sp.]HRO45086.1 dTDP-4-dehydrorhamnose 3,5-epimerase [Agriterribacter sp.]HRQ15473.1 dTDP-4-dehydrorhamnose 3,5-epimerase [Agriterribacter sp.]
MIFSPTPLPDSYLIDLEPFTDERGWFARFYCKKEFQQIGHEKEWVQMNHSFTAQQATIRGMHFQVHPYAEIKLVRCIAGRIFDVIIDLRKASPTFLQWFGIELSAKNKKMLYIPGGFAHGFQSLTDNCELIYHHTEYFTPEAESGIRYNDPGINIQWPLPAGSISERDTGHPYIDKNFKGL